MPHIRRVRYALHGLTGMRHDEGAALVWSDIDDTAPELARITLARQVSGSLKEDRYNQGLTRTIPLHPTLAAVLKAWRHEGWPTYFGRFPGPDDLVVPSPRSLIQNG